MAKWYEQDALATVVAPKAQVPEDIKDQANRIRDAHYYSETFGINPGDAFDLQPQLNRLAFGQDRLAAEPGKLFVDAFKQSLADKPAMMLRGATAYTPGKALGMDPVLDRASLYLESLKDPDVTRRVQTAAQGRLWPAGDERRWWQVQARYLPEVVNAWATNVGDQIPIMLITQAGRLGGKALGKAFGAAAGLAAAGATAGPDPTDVVTAPAVAGITTEVMKHLGGAAPLVAMEAGGFLDDARALNIDPDISEKYAQLYGVGSGAIEYAQQLWMLGRYSKIGAKAREGIVRIVLKHIGGSLFEGLEEISQGGLERFLLQKAVAEMKERHPDYEGAAPKITDGWKREGAIAAGVSFLTTLPGTGMTIAQGARTRMVQAKPETKKFLGEPSVQEVRRAAEKPEAASAVRAEAEAAGAAPEAAAAPALPAEAAPAAEEAIMPQSPEDAARALRIWQMYRETGDEGLLADMPPGAMITITPEEVSESLARTLETPEARAEFKENALTAVGLVEFGEADFADLVRELAAYQKTWGDIDPLPENLLRYANIAKSAPAEAAAGKEKVRQLNDLITELQAQRDETDLQLEAHLMEDQPDPQVTADLTNRVAELDAQIAGAQRATQRTPMPEKTEAIAVSAAQPAAERAAEAPPPPPAAPPGLAEIPSYGDALKRLRESLAKARKIIPVIREEKHQALRQRVGAAAGTMENLMAQGVPAREAVLRSTGMLKGELTQYEQRYESIRAELGAETVEALHRRIAMDGDLQYFQKLKLGEVLDRVLDGTALTLHEARLLGDYFGKDIGNAAMQRVPLGDRFWFLLMEGLNIPRTALASIDQSGILRQGRMLMQAHPEMATDFIAKYAQAFASEEFAQELEKRYKRDPLYKEAKSVDLEMPEWGRVDVNIAELAEEFAAARLLQWIPGVRASERSFVTALNWLRLSVYGKLVTQTEIAHNRQMTLDEKRHLARVINNLSGRSTLPQGLKQASPILNAIFFSPRFALSRLALLKDVPLGAARSLGELTLDAEGKPRIRLRTEIQPELALVVKAIASTMATNLLIIGLLAFVAGDDDDFEAEYDPRSSDFGKIRYQNFRIDLWAGYVQAARFLARLATGQVKTQAGEIRDVAWEDTLKQFLETKESPVASLLIDWWRGEDMLGRPFGVPPKGREGEILAGTGVPEKVTGAAYEIWKRIVPLVIQDATDALTLEGIPEGVTAGALAFFGAGVQTYEPSGFAVAKQKKNELANAAYGRNWDELKPSQQKRLRNQHDEIAALERTAKREAYPLTNLDLTEQARSTKRVYDNLSGPVQKTLNEHGISPGVSRRVFTDFWLNEKRYEAYERRAGEEIEKAVSQRIGMKNWPRIPSAAQAEIIGDTVARAKETARTKLRREIERGRL